MNQNYDPPSYGKDGFSCPICNAFSHQDWWYVEKNHNGVMSLYNSLLSVSGRLLGSHSDVNGYSIENEVAMSRCLKCGESSLWKKGNLINPILSTAPMPNPDMPEDVKVLYEEAREVSTVSAMASTALLRLAVEKLLPQIGAKKAKIDTMIGQLVGKGLPKEVEKALDSLRVIGNEAVHPGTIDINDNTDVAFALFKLLNFVVDRMITQLKEIDEIYDLLPEGKKQGIKNRNARFISEQGV
ncbi:DUF4145 domain-containing protein [Priestia megaterium]|uniref:DUF4145 domain-containing protein n=1 Tax=Priestia megaterium TaxID=1404 RepID=UPI002E228884|nr:DUF4145 domain-containing protein [Priestia megaterium]